MTEIIMMVKAFREGNIKKAEDYMRLFVENNPCSETLAHKRTDAEFLSCQFQLILSGVQEENTVCLDVYIPERIYQTDIPINDIIAKWKNQK